ncbi:spore coat protein CotJB [Pseudalkalibacillus caeni]|uniref:Spore coat protein CotJB n=1 Tax=Exobacillus caeni TaxID=2574798 RepID=A0A5R9EY95_9BACL|nr:spore coat protein CotJB [Pseudalkalibacillus caeni]TLS35469.1 spore coat protein CotJB [Pseudalkalibacillus caeni]
MNKELSSDFRENLKKLQAIDFAMMELTLYLDTHPDDSKAIEQYNEYSEKRKDLKQKVEEEYGPLMLKEKNNKENQWEWSQGPWPWQV